MKHSFTLNYSVKYFGTSAKYLSILEQNDARPSKSPPADQTYHIPLPAAYSYTSQEPNTSSPSSKQSSPPPQFLLRRHLNTFTIPLGRISSSAQSPEVDSPYPELPTKNLIRVKNRNGHNLPLRRSIPLSPRAQRRGPMSRPRHEGRSLGHLRQESRWHR